MGIASKIVKGGLEALAKKARRAEDLERKAAEAYAQMPEYLQDPYLGLSTSNIGKVTKSILEKAPRKSKATLEAEGYYHPIGNKLKLSKPAQEYTADIVDDPNMPLVPKILKSPEDLYGKVGIPLVGDRSDTGKLLRGIEGVIFDEPVILEGGFKFGRAHQYKNPKISSVWASDPNVVTSLNNQIKRAAESGKDVLGISSMGSQTMVDYNTMIAKSALNMTDLKGIHPKAIETFNSEIKNLANKNKETGKITTPFQNFLGIDHPEVTTQLLSKGAGELRKAFIRTMEKDQYRKLGFPEMAPIRKAVTDAEILDLPLGSTGLEMYKMSPEGNIVEAPKNPHSTYPVHMQGEVFGGFETPIDYKNMFSTFYEPKKLMSVKDPQAYRAYSLSAPIQEFNQQWLDEVMPIYQQKIKDITGRKKGGEIHPDGSARLANGASARKMVQYILKDQEGYAGGGLAKKIAKTLAKDYKPTKGKISEVKDYIRDAKGEYGAQRVERAADLVPNLEKQYSARALREAFDGDNAKSVMVINPAEYEKYAKQLPEYYGKPMSGIKFTEGKQVPITIPPSESYYDILTGKNPLERSDYTSRKMILDDYLDYLGQTARGKGLLEAPYLMLDESKGLKNFRIAGHEGRHRARALEKLGDESTLIRLLPRGIREGLPRSSQEEYQEGLKELLGPNPKVYPEKPYGDKYKENYRSLIELPEFFAEGGSVDKDPEQLRNIIKGILGSDIEKDQDFGAGGVVKNIAKKLAKELPEASASGKTPISTTVGTYKKASPILLEDIKDVNAPVLDYGSGMGLGAEELRKTFPNVKTLEPFYKGNFDFTDPSKVPSGEFKGLTNFSVLNTVTPEVRDSIVENIGRVMDRGGVGLITARSPSAVMSTKGRLANEPNSMITQKGTYQKGFDTDELREYIKYILGSDFEYEPLKGLSGTSVKVKKKADGGTITTPEIEVKPEYETLKEVPRGKISGKIADILKPASEFLGKYEVIPQIPLIGGTSIAELTGVEGLQTLADDMSRGYRPIRNLERGKLQSSYFDPRLADAADLGLTALGGIGAAKNLGKTAIKEGMRQIQTGEGMLGRNVINPRMNVIKDPGGMVVGAEKELDQQLLYLKKNEGVVGRYVPTENIVATGVEGSLKDKNAVALNSWVDTKVRKYIRNQAGSKDDPILKSIESGVEHNFTPPQSGDTKYNISMKRKFAGKDPQGIATTERGKDWEYTVDSIFNPVKSSEIKDILQRGKDLPPSIASDKLIASVLRTEHNLPVYNKQDLEALQLINQIPDETVYGLNPEITNRLGLNHMTDVLSEDLNAGRLRPEQLNQMSIEKAIRRVAEYDAEKAKIASKAEADRIKDLPTPITYNKDYKWLELKHPTDPAITKEALKSEGNQMGHCVGTHCDYYDGVMNGSKQIFSLRDANNKPHVTIETNIVRDLDRWLNANKETISKDPELSKRIFTDDFDEKYPRNRIDDEELVNMYIGNMKKTMKEKGLPIHEDPGAYVNIKQVKGNKNSRPKDPYQNYVTDFIQKNPTGHEIVDIYELENTNLMNVNDVSTNGIVPKEIHFHPDVEKAMTSFYPAFKNLMSADKEELTYRLFKTAAKDLARQNKNYFTGEDLLENIRNKYLPMPKAKGGSIDLQQEYKLENMRRRYG